MSKPIPVLYFASASLPDYIDYIPVFIGSALAASPTSRAEVVVWEYEAALDRHGEALEYLRTRFPERFLVRPPDERFRRAPWDFGDKEIGYWLRYAEVPKWRAPVTYISDIDVAILESRAGEKLRAIMRKNRRPFTNMIRAYLKNNKTYRRTVSSDGPCGVATQLYYGKVQSLLERYHGGEFQAEDYPRRGRGECERWITSCVERVFAPVPLAKKPNKSLLGYHLKGAAHWRNQALHPRHSSDSQVFYKAWQKLVSQDWWQTLTVLLPTRIRNRLVRASVNYCEVFGDVKANK